VIKINLAPTERRRGLPSFQLGLPTFDLGVLFAIVYVAVVLGVGATWLLRSSIESRLVSAIERDKRELASLKAQIGEGTKLKAQVAELQNRLKAIQELTKNQARPSALLAAFADTVPPDLWINTLEEKGATLKVSGTAYSPTAVSDFMTNLRGSGKFKEIDIVIAKSDLVKNPRPVTFEVTCRFEI
jgi:type IV pilus assembly protein PilN